VERALLSLRVPSNIEKKVRELKTFLYREGGVVSARALPMMIPLCFVPSAVAVQKRAALRDALRRALGRQAPLLRGGSIMEHEGFLFWNLESADELQRLSHRSAEVFGEEPSQLFPVARGFVLCSLEGRLPSDLPPVEAPERLSFPAKAAVVLRLRLLEAEPGSERLEATASEIPASETGAWWRSLFWEELERIPLRKSRRAD
jgi:hypothetical protein